MIFSFENTFGYKIFLLKIYIFLIFVLENDEIYNMYAYIKIFKYVKVSGYRVGIDDVQLHDKPDICWIC